MSLIAGVDGHMVSGGRAARGPFNRIVGTAVAAGLLAALTLTAVQTVRVAPIILQAEVYENAAAPAPLAVHADDHEHEHAHTHGQGQADAHPPGSAHEHAGWKPENGVQRTLYTLLANASMGVAYGLLLCAAMLVRGARPTVRHGLLWGAAGYAVFFIAPSLGLPPELPGTAAAPLGERQLWWSLTALATAGGIALLAFGRSWMFVLAGVILLAAPQLAGAPHPLVQTSTAPPELAHAFLWASALANAAFWLVLGSAGAFFFKKFA